MDEIDMTMSKPDSEDLVIRILEQLEDPNQERAARISAMRGVTYDTWLAAMRAAIAYGIALPYTWCWDATSQRLTVALLEQVSRVDLAGAAREVAR